MNLLGYQNGIYVMIPSWKIICCTLVILKDWTFSGKICFVH